MSPGVFGDYVNLSVEVEYGDHSWKLGDPMSFIHKRTGTFGDTEGELWEVRSRNVVDQNLYDGAEHEVAVAVVLPKDNSWGLVKAHMDGFGRWEGLDALESDLQVALPD